MVDVHHVVVGLVHVDTRLGRHVAIDRSTTRNLLHVTPIREIQTTAIDVDGPVGVKVGRLRGRNPEEARRSKAENAERNADPNALGHSVSPFCLPQLAVA